MAWFELYKSLHIIFMVTWFAGLFYLPRLFVYHAMADDAISLQRFKTMERKLYFGIMAPGAILTVVFGGLLIGTQGMVSYSQSGWLHAKLLCIAVLIVYHIYCGKLLFDFKNDRNKKSHIWYRWFNEVPVVFLFVIVILAVMRPF